MAYDAVVATEAFVEFDEFEEYDDVTAYDAVKALDELNELLAYDEDLANSDCDAQDDDTEVEVPPNTDNAKDDVIAKLEVIDIDAVELLGYIK